MKLDKRRARFRRHLRIRKKIIGTKERPRLSVYKSNKHIYAQIIDDLTSRTIVSASTLDKDLKEKIKGGCNINNAVEVGTFIAKKALKRGIEKVVFDRSGYIYHGRVKALAEAARKEGLKF
ncbi:MAG: 50S ribosomal protein L18 [Nitrospirae bacterium]|nr:MAG: 50S ribosomal protein L18 [Nitrospirota bacterium]